MRDPIVLHLRAVAMQSSRKPSTSAVERPTTVGTSSMRARLRELITEQYGDWNPPSLRRLAAASRVTYTTLARFVAYEEPARRTRSLRPSVYRAIALALDVRAEWLVDGQGDQQLGLWPILVSEDPEGEIKSPSEQVLTALEALEKLTPSTAMRGCRAAVAAMLESAALSGEMMPPEAYRCLMRLDAMQRNLAPGRMG